MRGQSRVFHHDLLSPLGLRAENEKRPQQKVCYRAVVEIGDWTGGKLEDLQFASLLPCSDWPVDSQGVPAGFGAWGNATNWEREVSQGKLVE